MRKVILGTFALTGWILFLLLLASSFIFNSFNGDESKNRFSPIAWKDHKMVFDGALTCSLTSAELMDRKQQLKAEIFPNLINKTELETGFIYYFEDEGELAEKIMEFIGKEKQCCPFFKFDFSILPFKDGLALQISGSKAIKDFLVDMESDFL